MQVSQQSDSITHASVGSKETVEMGVSDSSALMHILSTALYTYPKLAAMREIMCNGWDANIMNKATDKPLIVNVSSTHVSVKDSGTGIPPAKIGEIYGTYGNSTKRDDSTQTGGFGLGSKAPFAYVDNFEVINCHEGVKTIYRVSKSSMAKGGKPAISTVVSVPTEDTGITVKFALKHGDSDHFAGLVQEIAALGEIPVLFNDLEETLPVIPLSESETGYVITTYAPTIRSPIMVRYGNVVYPVPVADGFADEWNKVQSGMARLWGRTCVIFHCPPDTVSIQPSREALILTEGTVKTLKTLLGKFDTEVIQRSRGVIKSFFREGLNKAVSRSPADLTKYQANVGRHRNYYASSRKFEVPYGIERDRLNHLGNNPLGTVDFTLRNASLRYQAQQTHSDIDSNIQRRKIVEHIIKEGNYSSSHIKYLKELLHIDKAQFRWGKRDDVTDNDYPRQPFAVYMKRVFAPFIQKVRANEMLKEENLSYPARRWGDHGEWVFHTKIANSFNSIELDNWYHMFKPLVVVYTSVKYMKERLYNLNSHPYGTYAYYLPVRDKNREEIIQFFKDIGCEVRVEIAPPKEREPTIAKEVDPNAPIPVPKKSVKRKGFLSLKSAYDREEDEWLLNAARANCTENPELEVKKPIAWTILKTKGNASNLLGFNREISMLIWRRFGDQVAVVTSVQAAKLEKEGVPELNKFVYTHVDGVLSQSKDFRRYLAFGLHLGETRSKRRGNFIFNMLGHKTLMDELGLRYHISMDTHVLTEFFENEPSKMPLCAAIATKVKRSPQVTILTQKMRESEWHKYINTSAISTALDVYTPDSPQLTIPYELVRKMLK